MSDNTKRRRPMYEIDGEYFQKCSKCQSLINLKEFKLLKCGNYDSWCKSCYRVSALNYLHKNKETINQKQRERKKLKNKDKIVDSRSVYQKDIENGYKICKRCSQKLVLERFDTNKVRNMTFYRLRCRQCLNEMQKERRHNNADRIKEQGRRYYYNGKNIPRVIERKKIEKRRYYEKKIEDINFRLNGRVSGIIGSSLKNGKEGRSWKTMVNYTLNELKSHIESKFTEGMNWEEFKIGNIHIDHVLPRELFSYESPNDIQFKICWSLNNLQPLWEKDNLTKNDTLPNGRAARTLSPQEKLDYLRSLGFDI